MPERARRGDDWLAQVAVTWLSQSDRGRVTDLKRHLYALVKDQRGLLQGGR